MSFTVPNSLHAPSTSIESTLQHLMISMNAINNNMTVMSNKFDVFVKEISEVKERMEVVEGDVKYAFKEIYQLRDTVNTMDQANRSLSIRIAGLPTTADEVRPDAAKATARNAYDRIIKPLLSHAKDKAFISKIPTINNTIISATRMKSKNASLSKPTTILIKLASHSIKAALFKSKREALPQPMGSEVEAGLRRFHLAEDLTQVTLDFLKELREHQSVERAWTTDGEVRYTKKGDPTNFVFKVKSISSNINTLLS